MKKILLLGAGKSTSYLIKYLSENGFKYDWEIILADQSESMAWERATGFPNVHPLKLEDGDLEKKDNPIVGADIVISMLPPPLHPHVAKLCLKHGKPMVTASYATEEIKSLDAQARAGNSIILMEMGLDPGIDHMSSMKEIDHIHQMGGTLVSYRSYTGGLIAPESDNNPWNYKITWNPRNVVLAGQGTVKYLSGSSYKYIPYHRLFTSLYDVNIEDFGKFEGYPNRDSLSYLTTYKLSNMETFIRGTLRRPGFATAWNALVQLGMTDDSFTISNTANLTYKDFTASFLPDNQVVEKAFYKATGLNHQSSESEKIEFLNLFGDEKIDLQSGTPAMILQEIIEKKWKLEKDDKDMVVMQHEFEYIHENKRKKIISSLVNLGTDQTYTAMARTVGIPLGIATKLILNGQVSLKGVHIPVLPELYNPILNELEEWDIKFKVKII